MPKIEEMKTYKINDVEVFSAGKWNNDEYTIADLHGMVTTFYTLKEGLRPFLKLGHDNDQKLASSSGLPSVGWISDLFVRGDKLIANFEYVPEKIYKLIKTRAYRKVSCEIYWNLDVNGTKYPHALGAVALLGAENPGVMNLADILGQYSFLDKKNDIVLRDSSNQDTFKSYSFNFNNQHSEDNLEELEQVKNELDETKKSYSKVEADMLALKKELEDKQKAQEQMESEVKEYRLAKEKAELEAKSAKVSKFVTELEANKLASPAMSELLSELLSDKKEYSIKEKTYSKEDLLTEILTLSKENAKVNFDESSRADFKKSEDKMSDDEKAIEEYMKDNKCSYSKAYREVMKKKSSKEEIEA